MLNTITERPKCGEIWMCKLEKKEGSIQSGYRPVFVISNDKNNTYSTTLNIIPITSRQSKKNLPVHVKLYSYKDYGLSVPSTMLVEQIMTINLEDMDKKLGAISDNETLKHISDAIAIQFPVVMTSTAVHTA